MFSFTRMSFAGRALKQTNHKLISLSEISSVLKLPDGLTFGGLDLQTGFVSPFGVMWTLTYSQLISRIISRELAKDHYLFVGSGEVKVTKDIYNVQVAKYPVFAESRLVSYQKSSLLLETCLALPGYQTPVASVRINVVCIAKDTRKPTPLPDWWAKKYINLFEKTASPYFKPFVSLNKPICRGFKTQPYTFPVRRREQDKNGHVNTAVYPQFCLDALEHHLSINNINCDIHTVSLLLKSAQWLHRGESQMGDILTVAFWNEETDPETVCFDITKSGQSIYQARMQFYGGSEIVTGIKSHL